LGYKRRVKRRFLVLGLCALAGCGPCSEQEEPAVVATPSPSVAAPAATPSPSPSPSPTPVSTPGSVLAVGLTEQNPNFLWPPAVHEVPPEFERWRAAVGELRPAYYRLVVDWAVLEPAQGQLKFDELIPGCMRSVHPCGPYLSLKDQLGALAARQKEGGWAGFVVLSGTPEWAARPPGGCERDGTLPRSRPPTSAADYGRFVERVLELARSVGADLRYWSPANEPNHPFFLSPQRQECRASAPSAAISPYVAQARVLKRVLDAAPGEQELVLGELAGLDERRPMTTSIREFASRLPRDLVCAARVWSQHGYVGGRDPVDELWRGLRRQGCERPAIWITETGVGAPRAGEQRRTSPESQKRACSRLHRRLVRWYRDPRVTAAFQYTFREDDLFPTGLVTTDLTSAYPALGAWTAWGGARAPGDPPPEDACA
jgi:hypothetical protein